ncbi:MAG: hypothetical protein DWQ01_16995 [Planctomycetota bacterium]|nr:MAG: hypothetical protein DWQ01_16995 [Planctomycetota bacterium]
MNSSPSLRKNPNPEVRIDPQFAGKVWLLPSLLALAVSNGHYVVPMATWAAPFFLLRFLSSQKLWIALILGWAVTIIGHGFMWQGHIPAPGIFYYAMAAVWGSAAFLPFALFRLLAPYLQGVPRSFILPLAWVANSWLFHRWLSPYGSWGSLAYTQWDQKALIQLAYLTGYLGIDFLICWFAGSLEAALALPRNLGFRRWRPLWLCSAVLLGVLLYGDLRLRMAPQELPTVRVAMVMPAASLKAANWQALQLYRKQPQAGLEALTHTSDRIFRDQMERSRREAAAGARLICWAEASARLPIAQEGTWLQAGSDLCREHGIYLALSYGTLDSKAEKPLVNKTVLMNPEGEMEWEYRKAHPVVMPGALAMQAGDGNMPLTEAPWGRISGAICHDLDFPHLIRPLKTQDVDLMLCPADDWPAIARLHTAMSAMRAVENGFALIRPTVNGTSVAVDRYGRTLATANIWNQEDPVCLVEIPLRRR